MTATANSLPPLTRAEALEDAILQQLQTIDTDLLSAIALREVDVHQLARRTLDSGAAAAKLAEVRAFARSREEGAA